jgi:hypothetical protein
MKNPQGTARFANLDLHLSAHRTYRHHRR